MPHEGQIDFRQMCQIDQILFVQIGAKNRLDKYSVLYYNRAKTLPH